MAYITFTDYQTLIPASWLNDVNTAVYTLLGNGTTAATTKATARTNLGVMSNGGNANLASGTYTTGALIYASSTSALNTLAIGSTGNILTVSGGVPVWSISSSPIKAWVNFNGSGTIAIRDSFNVSSITDNGVGDYSINFTTSLVNANYAVNGNHSSSGGNISSLVLGTSPSTSSCRITTLTNAGVVDPTFINVMIASN